MNTRYEHEKEYTITGPKIGITRVTRLLSDWYERKYSRAYAKLMQAREKSGYPEGFKDEGVEVVAGFLWNTYEFYFLNAENELCGEYEGRLVLFGGEEEERIIQEGIKKENERSEKDDRDGD